MSFDHTDLDIHPLDKDYWPDDELLFDMRPPDDVEPTSPVYWLTPREWNQANSALKVQVNQHQENHRSNRRGRQSLPSRIVHGSITHRGVQIPATLDIVDGQLLIRENGRLRNWTDCPFTDIHFQPKPHKLPSLYLDDIFQGRADMDGTNRSSVSNFLEEWEVCIANNQPNRWTRKTDTPVPPLPAVSWDF